MIIFLYFYLVWLIIYYYSNLSQFKSISNQTCTNGLYNEETVPSRATALPPSLGPCSTTGLTTGHLEGPAGRVQGQGSMNILLRRENLQETMVPWCTMTFFHLQEQMYLRRCGGYCSSWIVWAGVKMKGRLMSLDQHPQVVFFLIVVHKGGISVINILS